MTILYFARLRDEVGCSEEKLDLPSDVTTVQELLLWLRQRSDGHAFGLSPGTMLKVAVNQEHAQMETTLKAHDEVAFFPPVTGG